MSTSTWSAKGRYRPPPDVARPRISLRKVAVALLLAALFAAPFAAHVLDNPHVLAVASRLVIMAIAAVGLNLVLGFGGLVSLGHAAYLGVGAYAVGILAHHGVQSGWLQFAVAMAACALIALVIGALSLRTRGVYFIMVTLAFAQMLYFVGVGLAPYGGDDGLTIHARSQFGAWLPLHDQYVFYGLCLALLIAVAAGIHVIRRSPFGLVLLGAASNERRVKAIGYPVYRYQLAAYVISGLICGVAGMLLANLNNFASPSMMHWTRSAELVIMLILGGTATVLGPLFGAAALLTLEELLSSHTHYWQAALGLLLLLAIRFARGGIDGLLAGGRHGR